jgi:hypothetical protein
MDEPQPITGIERASTRLGVLRKGKYKGNTISKPVGR